MNASLSSQLIDSRNTRDVALRNAQGAAYVRHARLVRMLAAYDSGALLPSGIRTALDAALTKAGRKAAPEPVRHMTIAGGAR